MRMKLGICSVSIGTVLLFFIFISCPGESWLYLLQSYES